jgi:hypothetical protein
VWSGYLSVMGKRKHTPMDEKAKGRSASSKDRKPDSGSARDDFVRRGQSAADKNTDEGEPKGQ